MVSGNIEQTIDARLKEFQSNGFIQLRLDASNKTTYLDIFNSSGNGIILGISASGISCWHQQNGTQTQLFQNH